MEACILDDFMRKHALAARDVGIECEGLALGILQTNCRTLFVIELVRILVQGVRISVDESEYSLLATQYVGRRRSCEDALARHTTCWGCHWAARRSRCGLGGSEGITGTREAVQASVIAPHVAGSTGNKTGILDS